LRGLTVVAWVIGGLPVVAFAATLALTDGAPSTGSGMSDAARVVPDRLGRPALAPPAGTPTRAGDQSPRTVLSWKPPPPAEFHHDRTRAGWDQLRRLAESGDRDALVFLTLMQSGAIPGSGRISNASAP
jgi:hypothetical protein